jgi:capsular exopolysaccharide synthesis family protein
MGRVYEALKRANSIPVDTKTSPRISLVDDQRRRSSAEKLSSAEEFDQDVERVLGNPIFFPPVTAPATESAFTAHTEDRIGSALTGAKTSRSVGATLDAVGSMRAGVECREIDIDAARVEPHLVTITQPRSGYCEHFRSLRTQVMQSCEKQGNQAFVITSPNIGEGKTITALNLAWMLAQSDGIRALVIDADLRRPCASRYLGIPEGPGLSEMLSDEASLGECVVRLNPAGLYLLPGGAAREDVAELLSGPKFNRVMAEVRKRFDCILIDAPPLGIFTDATVLINRADSAMMVVRAGHTRYSVVEKLMAKLPRERVLGIVLNRSEEVISESDYYYSRDRPVLNSEPIIGAEEVAGQEV